LQIFCNNGKPANFYIQSHGLNAGRPLRQPIRNCYAVITDCPDAFEIVYCLYQSKVFEQHIIGSVIPFIRVRTVFALVNEAIQLNFSKQNLKLINNIDRHLANNQDTRKQLKLLIFSVARQAYKEAQDN